jgi:hypothetical protein
MYIIREVLNCRPGKVRMMIENFQTISKALEEMGRPPLRLLTDVSGEPFWTLVVEASVNTVEEFVEMERAVTEQPSVQAKLGGYHDLIQSGRREIYRIEPPPR